MSRRWFGGLLAGLLAVVPLGASGITFSVSSGGMDDGQLCDGGGAACSEGGGKARFDSAGLAAASGTIDLDLVNELISITLNVPTSIFDDVGGPHGGVSRVVFSNTTYTITNVPIDIIGTQVVLDAGITAADRDGQAFGNYVQLDAVNAVVVADQFFNTVARIQSAFLCQLSAGNTAILCGTIFGPGQTSLPGIGDLVDPRFRHQFDFTGEVPEPGVAVLVGLGALGLLGVSRRAR
jgi:hypothetical protein